MGTTQLVRAASRSLGRTPLFALAVTLIVALGLGLSIAVFAVADALLLRRLPVARQDRLVALWGEMRDHSLDNVPLRYADAHEFSQRTRTLQDVAFFAYEGSWPAPLRDGDRFVRLRRALVSGNYFNVLGAQPLLGRTLRPSDDVPGAAPVAVVSYDTWRGLFGESQEIIGRRLSLEETGVTYTVVGVMPSGLGYPSGTELWLPIAPITTVNGSTNALVDLVGRLTAEASLTSAEAELTAFFAHTNASAPTQPVRGVVRALPRVILGNTRPAVLVFAAAAALLLIIACLNVANLILVRGLARARELAIRSALGASRRQIIAHLLAENGILAVVGGAVGVGLAVIAIRSLIALAPADIPLLNTVRIDARVVGGALALTAAAMVLFGVMPALVARADAQAVLRSGTRLSASRRSRLAREILVAAQVALAVLVLAAAALLGRSMLKLENADLHFDDSQLLIAELGMRYDRYDDVNKQRSLVELVLASVRAAPGVRAASPVLTVPFSGAGGWDAQAATDDQSADEAVRNPMFNLELVTPEYFQTLGIGVVRGRLLIPSDREGSQPVAVVSESMARRYWPSENPIGKRLRVGRRSATVVGVVPDTRYRDLRDLRATAYFPLAQSTFTFAPTALAIRTSTAPATAIAEVRRAISEAAPGVFLANAAPFASFEAGPLAQPRLNALLLVVFALSAALLAGVGLFATMATLVRQRTHEFGVRMALGATAGDVQSLMMRRGLTLAAGGVGIGLMIALLTNRLLSSLLFDITPTDPSTLIGVGALLLIIGVVATFIPARTSAHVDPALALRSEA